MFKDSEFTANAALDAQAQERARFAAVLGARPTVRRSVTAKRGLLARLFGFKG